MFISSSGFILLSLLRFRVHSPCLVCNHKSGLQFSWRMNLAHKISYSDGSIFNKLIRILLCSKGQLLLWSKNFEIWKPPVLKALVSLWVFLASVGHSFNIEKLKHNLVIIQTKQKQNLDQANKIAIICNMHSSVTRSCDVTSQELLLATIKLSDNSLLIYHTLLLYSIHVTLTYIIPNNPHVTTMEVAALLIYLVPTYYTV